jgi:hypothetical protein
MKELKVIVAFGTNIIVSLSTEVDERKGLACLHGEKISRPRWIVSDDNISLSKQDIYYQTIKHR